MLRINGFYLPSIFLCSICETWHIFINQTSSIVVKTFSSLVLFICANLFIVCVNMSCDDKITLDNIDRYIDINIGNSSFWYICLKKKNKLINCQIVLSTTYWNIRGKIGSMVSHPTEGDALINDSTSLVNIIIPSDRISAIRLSQMVIICIPCVFIIKSGANSI